MRAVADLRRDLEKVLGKPSRILQSLDASRGEHAIIVTCSGEATAPFRDGNLSGAEAHEVAVRNVDGVPHVVLQGADARGTIYAVYSFSEHFLGIPPLWFWASLEPQRKANIPIPAETKLLFQSPYVKWRAWFPNDRDLLIPWQKRSEENYEAFFETMLRLKLNTLEGKLMDSEAFSKPHTAGREARQARDRGLAITGHHIYTFGSSMRDWARYWERIRNHSPPRTSIRNRDALLDFWRYHIETTLEEKMEAIWLIGFRGDRDIPFWRFYEDSPETDAERGQVIQRMMAAQVDLLKEVTGNPAPFMRTTLYSEKSLLFSKGLLRPPDEPTLIWNFVAARRDHFPAPDIQNFEIPEDRPLGYYMNFQFTSSGSHLAQAEGPWKMERNFRYVDGRSPRPLEFSVVNAGNIREHVLSLSANARMMWDFEAYDTDTFLVEFCERYYGEAHAERIADLYRDFFHSYWRQKKPDLPGFERQYLFQDMRYARAIEQLCAQFPKGYDPDPLKDRGFSTPGEYFRIDPEESGAPSQVEAIVKGTRASIEKLEEVVERCRGLYPSLPQRRRPFFNDNLLIPAKFMLELNRTLNALTTAFIEQETKPRDTLEERMDDALEAVKAMRRVLKEAEQGRFQGWYEGDEKFGLERIQEKIERVRARFIRPDG